MSLSSSSVYEVRCPILGTIGFDQREKAIIQHPLVQRLRQVSQLGFSSLVYPGATHTRFSHSLGAMHLSGKMWDYVTQKTDALFGKNWLPLEERTYCRRIVRMAGLLHDVGHAPFSHTFDSLFPLREEVSLPKGWYRSLPQKNHAAPQATHEDYSVLILHHLAENSPLLDGQEAQDIGGLIHPQVIPATNFQEMGKERKWNPWPLLQQLVSSQLDADRMDYLPRDALFTGVAYGHIDSERLLTSLACVPREGLGACLAIGRDALMAYEHFQLTRVHMTLQVYLHKTASLFQEYLVQALCSKEVEAPFPKEAEGVLGFTEPYLWMKIGEAKDKKWSGRLYHRKPLFRLRDLVKEPLKEKESWKTLKKRFEKEGVEILRIGKKRNLLSSPKKEELPMYVYQKEKSKLDFFTLKERDLTTLPNKKEFKVDNLYCPHQEREKALRLIG